MSENWDQRLVSSLKEQAPETPERKASWRAVYLEPIPNSGERITVGVVFDENQKLSSFSALNPPMLSKLFGEHGKVLVKLGSELLSDFVSHGRLEDWTPIFSNAYVGPIRYAFGNDIYEMVREAFALSASFSVMSEYFTQEMVGDEDPGETHIVRTVRQGVLRSRDWQKKFNVSFDDIVPNYRGPSNPTNFYGKNLVANFSRLSESGPALNRDITSTKSKMADLLFARKVISEKLMVPDLLHELMVVVPKGKGLSSDKAARVFDELEELADLDDLRVVKAESSEELISRVLQLEN